MHAMFLVAMNSLQVFVNGVLSLCVEHIAFPSMARVISTFISAITAIPMSTIQFFTTACTRVCDQIKKKNDSVTFLYRGCLLLFFSLIHLPRF